MTFAIQRFGTRCAALAAAGLALAALQGPVFAAEAFPARSVRLMVPYPPGGGTDVLARIVAPKLAEALKQPVVIENRGGAGGTIGTAAVAQAAPDGYTILIANTLPHTWVAGLYSALPFDPVKSFDSVGMIASVPYMLAVNPKLPGAIGSGIHRPGPFQARHHQLRIGGQRQRDAPRRRAVQERDQDRNHAMSPTRAAGPH